MGQTTSGNFWELTYSALRPSSSNIWPKNYKFIGLEIIFNTDLKFIDRQSYDFLTFLADVGGLDQALYVFGFIIMRGFSRFNAYSYLISLLFVRSSSAFQGIRNIMKEPKDYDSDDDPNGNGSFKKSQRS